jgi:Uncharacterized protein conserved in bacteria
VETFLLAFVFIAIVITIMSVGVIFGRAPIKGSCGGMGAVGIGAACELCGGDPNRCETEFDDVSSSSGEFYSADSTR